ncbi:MAG: hypothetical protein H0X43_02190 [Nitrosospira sp.]|nr:hypothetical protein [Nitrosospira sp.]
MEITSAVLGMALRGFTALTLKLPWTINLIEENSALKFLRKERSLTG